MLVEKYHTDQVNPDEYKEGAFFKKNDIFDSYKFTSTGDSGSFELMVFIFRSKQSKYLDDYTLGFGKLDPVTYKLNDRFQTRNGDVDKILATVADIALNFLEKTPNAEIFAQGSTPARTRLYQQGIGKNMDIIPPPLRIEGLIYKDNQGWSEFEKGINYDAFLLSAK